jgi:hypothetical protein
MHVSSLLLAPITMHVTVVAAEGLRGMRQGWKTRHQQSRQQKRDLAHIFLPTLGDANGCSRRCRLACALGSATPPGGKDCPLDFMVFVQPLA